MLPHDAAAERAVLGAMLIDNAVIDEVRSAISAPDFYVPAHGHIYEAIIVVRDGGAQVDELTLLAHLRARGETPADGGAAASFVSGLVDSTPSAANVSHYVEIVTARALSRRLILAGKEIADDAAANADDAEGAFARAESRIFELGERRDTREMVSIKEVVREAFAEIEKRAAAKSPVTGIATGYTEIDRLLAGMQNRDFIVIGARPSMGKSALMLNIAENVAVRSQTPSSVAIFSLEMGNMSLAMRLLGSVGRVDAQRLRTGMLVESDYARLASAFSQLAAAKIMLDDSPALTVEEIVSKCRRLRSRGKLDLAMVDYLQFIKVSRETGSREQDVSAISRKLKGLAKELSIPVVALCQLNRSLEARSDKRPMMSDLRESGAIEQDADVIAFLYRDEVYDKESADKGIAEFNIAKQRNGPIGMTRLKWMANISRFENLAGEA
jgi:replicative DNA helicase